MFARLYRILVVPRVIGQRSVLGISSCPANGGMDAWAAVVEEIVLLGFRLQRGLRRFTSMKF
jgi:hypothetical protein